MKKNKFSRQVFDLSGLQEQLNQSHSLLRKEYQEIIEGQQEHIKRLEEKCESLFRSNGNLSEKVRNLSQELQAIKDLQPDGKTFYQKLKLQLIHLGVWNPPEAKTSSMKVSFPVVNNDHQ